MQRENVHGSGACHSAPLTTPWSGCAHPTRHTAATWQQGQSQRWPAVVGSLAAALEINVLVARQAAVHAHPRGRGGAARGWRVDCPPALAVAVARQAQRVTRQSALQPLCEAQRICRQAQRVCRQAQRVPCQALHVPCQAQRVLCQVRCAKTRCVKGARASPSASKRARREADVAARQAAAAAARRKGARRRADKREAEEAKREAETESETEAKADAEAEAEERRAAVRARVAALLRRFGAREALSVFQSHVQQALAGYEASACVRAPRAAGGGTRVRQSPRTAGDAPHLQHQCI